MDYRYGSHTVYNIEYQMSRSPSTVTRSSPVMLRSVCGSWSGRPVRSSSPRSHKGVISKDHGLILVSAPSTMAPSEIMRRIKGCTSSKLFEEFPILKKRY
jgi:putative transposase